MEERGHETSQVSSIPFPETSELNPETKCDLCYDTGVVQARVGRGSSPPTCPVPRLLEFVKKKAHDLQCWCSNLSFMANGTTDQMSMHQKNQEQKERTRQKASECVCAHDSIVLFGTTEIANRLCGSCLLYTSPSPRD